MDLMKGFWVYIKYLFKRDMVVNLINIYQIHYRKFVLIFGIILISLLLVSSFYNLNPLVFLIQGIRVLSIPIYSNIYHQDTEYIREATSKYWVGYTNNLPKSSFESWKRLEGTIPGFRLTSYRIHEPAQYLMPFVYESPNAKYLKIFKEKYRMDSLIRGSADEYSAMLILGGWLGTRWDHGVDAVPGGNMVCDPAAVVEAGEHGAKFWCEIAARIMVHAATALGWQARLVTASRDGYTWEHAVAELWSNQFNKWFVIDTDFNIVYENLGIPLSAFELSRSGERLRNEGKLTVRSIAQQKKSLSSVDLIPFYNYVHIDMRNDWCSRLLRKGSPAGGDLATWWTARPSLDRLLTGKVRVDDPTVFNWSVNSVAIYVIGVRYLENQISLYIKLMGYSPVFSVFEISVDEQPWRQIDNNHVQAITVANGVHTIRARLVTSAGYQGPESQITFDVVTQKDQ